MLTLSPDSRTRNTLFSFMNQNGKTMNQFAPHRATRNVLGTERSCYEAFCMGLLQEKDICCECTRYNGIIFKKKRQDGMGKAFRCIQKRKWEVSDLPEQEPIEDQPSTKRSEENKACNLPSIDHEAASWKILKVIDLNGGICTFRGYDLLREVEHDGDRFKRGAGHTQIAIRRR